MCNEQFTVENSLLYIHPVALEILVIHGILGISIKVITVYPGGLALILLIGDHILHI